MAKLKALYFFYKKVLSLLSKSEIRSFHNIFIASFFLAIIEAFGVVLIIPFISIVAEPDIITTNSQLNLLYINLKFTSENKFIFFIGVCYFLYLISSQLFKFFFLKNQSTFIYNTESSLSIRLLESYLSRPYAWFLNMHSGDMGKGILSEVTETIHYSLSPLLILITQSFLILILISLLVILDPYVALISLSLIGIINSSIFLSTKKRIKDLGTNKVNINKKRFKTVIETFGAIKEIKLNGLEKIYLNEFKESAVKFSNSTSKVQIVNTLPKFLLETIILGFLIVFILYSLWSGKNLTQVLPVLSMFAFAALKLMPSSQQVFSSLNKLTYSHSWLENLLSVFKENNNYYKNKELKNSKLEINQNIQIENLSFYYHGNKSPAINNINLKINVGEKIGFVGSTGSGKTTLVDLIIGLLEYKHGKILIDKKLLGENNKRHWQNSIGYVSQSIFLSDKTIAENIAFGIPKEKIDLNKVIEVSRIAHIHDFIMNQIKDDYNSEVGERGIRLSGGQRQRIGIARALYNNPTLLVLDEATSALDNKTENLVMNSINNYREDLTIIVIAHRLNTIINCNCIYHLEKGKIKSFGKYDELMKNNDFKDLSSSAI